MESNQVVATKNTNLLAIGGLSALVGFGLTYLLQKQKEKEESEPASPSRRVNSKNAGDESPRRKTKKQKAESNYLESLTFRLNLGAKISSHNELIEELTFLDEPTCEIQNIPHLAAILGVKDFETHISPLLECDTKKAAEQGYLPEMSFISQNSYVLSKAHFGPKNSVTDAKKYLRAGPRKYVYFHSDEVKACIVTCGGLCPGLNVVIREIVNCLYYNYRVKSVHGIRYGHKGFYTYEWEELTPEKVLNIHHLGGSILGSSRGGFDVDKILDAVVKNGINQIYCIGGDGTHRSIYELFKEISKRKLRITVVGVPKTIDNDIPIIDKSFGFESAVEEATRAIRSADVEANAAEYGVGLVKLMGRHAGFIAMYASLANRDVNICLVPEFSFELGGPRGLLEFVARRLKFKRKCVIVAAEGIPSAILDARLDDVGQNASGQVMFADAGLYLKDKIIEHCQNKGINVTLKYIDPTYMIRSIPANALDKQICSQLAQNAVHGAMSGWTGYTIANVNDQTCYIPLSEIITSKRQIEENDRTWQRLLASTGQPSFLNDEDYAVEADLIHPKN